MPTGRDYVIFGMLCVLLGIFVCWLGSSVGSWLISHLHVEWR
jgi:hypothetical protein